MLGTRWVSIDEQGASAAALHTVLFDTLECKEDPFPTVSTKVTVDKRKQLAERIMAQCETEQGRITDILLTGEELTYFDLTQIAHEFGFEALEGKSKSAGDFLTEYSERKREEDATKSEPKAIHFGACDSCFLIIAWKGKPSFKSAACPYCMNDLERATKVKFNDYALTPVKTRRDGRTLSLTADPLVTAVTIKQNPILKEHLENGGVSTSAEGQES